MKIVVIGGSGFIGQSLCMSMVSNGHRVTSVSRSPARPRLEKVEYIDCNYDNIFLLSEQYQRADIIFHLACDTTPATSSQQCSLEGMANIIPFLRLIDFLECKTSTPLVYLSSGGAIYGDQKEACDETTQTSPVSHYGAGKVALEGFLRSYHSQSKNSVIILRPANIYGPGQLAKQAFGVIPALFESVTQQSVFECSGTGEQARDYLYIEDFIDLCQKIIQSPIEKNCFEILNCGSQKSTTLNELIKLVEHTTQYQLETLHQEQRPSDIQSISLDCQKAYQKYNWSPKIPIKTGIKLTWKWWLKQTS